MTTTVASIETKILTQGWGPGAWHGPDMKAALGDVDAELAHFRPAPERHSIAEVALHHGFAVRAVRAKITGAAAEPFPFEGEDWFAVTEKTRPGWPEIRDLVEREHERLSRLLEDVASRSVTSPLGDDERLELALGITCHAAYHAGQVQLLKKLKA